MYSKEEVDRLLGIAFQMGVEAGEKGIPKDFKSYNPEHMEWHGQKCLDAKDYIIENKSEFLKDL